MDKLRSFKDTIIDHRSNVFDKDGTVKAWKANELAIVLFLKIFFKPRVPLKPPSQKSLPHVPECPLNKLWKTCFSGNSLRKGEENFFTEGQLWLKKGSLLAQSEKGICSLAQSEKK